MHRIFGNWFHWSISNNIHAGLLRGNNWQFRFEKHEYATCIFYRFHRLFISIATKPPASTDTAKGEE